jgi:ABC-type sugar transport system substrate-binding protein
MPRRMFGAAGLVCTVALIAAGCGGGDDDNGGAAKGGGVKAGTGSRAATAAAAGKDAAKQAGGKVDLPAGKTIGFLQILGGIESADRVANAAKTALKQVGYKLVVCDGQGDPTKWATCGDSLLSRGVDAIFQTGIEPSQIRAQIKKAKAKNVPFLQMGGLVSPGFDGSYYPDEPRAGKVLTDDIVKKLNALPDKTVDIAVHDYPAPWATTRTDQLKAAVKSDPKLKITASTQTDPTNLVNGTRKTVVDQITANPKLKAFWFAFDSAGQAGGQAVQSKYPGKSFPDRPLVATFHADLGTIDLMRKGAIDEVVDVPYDAGAWIATDQLLEHWARKKGFEQSPQPKYPGVGDLFDYEIVTKDNLPPKGQYRDSKVDFVTYFENKWKAEFGTAQ